MRKIVLLIVFLTFFSIFDLVYSIEWVSTNHLNRIIMDVYIYTPYKFYTKLELGSEEYNLIEVTIPIVLDSKALGMYNCSDMLIYFGASQEELLYYYIDERPEYSCGTHNTQIFVKTKAYYLGDDDALQFTVFKTKLIIYYNALNPFYNKYYNNFYKVFDSYGFPATYFTSSGYYYGEISLEDKKTNFDFSYNFVKINLTSYDVPEYREIYFNFVLRPKIKGSVTFYAKDVDDFIRLCEAGLYPVSSSAEPCKTEILKRDSCCGDAQGSINLDVMRVFTIYFENGPGPGGFKMYVKHMNMDLFRMLDVYDSVLLNYFDIGALYLACPIAPGLTVRCYVLPVLQFSSSIEVQSNVNVLYNYYQYVTKIELDNTNGYGSIFSLIYPYFIPSDFGTLMININTSKLIKENKLDSQCDNILFLFENKTLVYFYFDKDMCNRDNTPFFVRIPNINAGEIKYLYLYTSPVTKTGLSDIFYSFDKSFSIVIKFNNLTDVYNHFDTSGGYCGGYRYFDVVNNRLYVYGSSCGTILYTRTPIEPLYIRANILQSGSGEERLFSSVINDIYGQLTWGIHFTYNGIENSMIIGELKPGWHYTKIYNIYRNVYYTFVPSFEIFVRYIQGYTIIVTPRHYACIYNPNTFLCWDYIPEESIQTTYMAKGSLKIGSLYNVSLVIDKIAGREEWFEPHGFRYAVGVAEQVAPIEYYNITLRAVDENNNPVSTNIYIDGVRRDLNVPIQISKGTHTISADVPSGYNFDRWVSIYGNVIFENAYNLTTKITVNGNDIITLRLKKAPIKYRINLLSLDMNDNIIPTNIYINNVRYSTGTYVELESGTYSITADIPSNYSFVRWESLIGNVVFSNPNLLNTYFTVNGNDTIILRLNYTVIPVKYYEVTCYIVDENNLPIQNAKIVIGNIECLHNQKITIREGTYRLDTILPYNYSFYRYESNLYIYSPTSKITNINVNSDGYVKSILKLYEVLPTLPKESIVRDLYSYHQLLLLIAIIIIGGIIGALSNFPIGISFIVSGIIFTFLPKDALGYFVLFSSAVLTYFIVKLFIR